MNAVDKLKPIKLLAMDVDGVLTEGAIIVGMPEDIKIFSAQDGLGIRLAMVSWLDIVWITGNISTASAAKRAKLLKITEYHEGQRFKSAALCDIRKRKGLSKNEIAYIGDDLNDIPAMQEAGVAIAVANAAMEVKAAADFVTEKSGGRGAVREVIEMILKAQGKWEEGVQAFLHELQKEQERGEAPGAIA